MDAARDRDRGGGASEIRGGGEQKVSRVHIARTCGRTSARARNCFIGSNQSGDFPAKRTLLLDCDPIVVPLDQLEILIR